MSRVNLFNGVSIYVEATGKTYHTYDTWGLYVNNTDYIKDPKQYTNYITVPGRTGKIDASDVLTGRPIFTHREIKISLAGTRFRTDWDSVISGFRNDIMGQICRITFDNDSNYYWRGRIGVIDFSSVLDLGKFYLTIPEAEPYKYNKTSSAEPWLWDPFNFETDVITYLPSQQITVSGTITIPAGHMLTCPTLLVSDIVGGTFTVEVDGVTYSLIQGSNVIPSIMVGGGSEVDLDFTGTAKVQIIYRSGSL